MARDILQVNLELDRIKCHDEGDGWGSAEPYLWTVFFKVDGTTVSVSDSLGLSGQAVMHNTPGSHGNLGVNDVDEGDQFNIPSAVGHWQTYLKPIPVPEPLNAFQEDIGGVVGVIAILMEEDNVSDDGAEAGHQALNNAVRDAINQIVATRDFQNQDISDAEIEALTSDIKSAISNAIQDQQNFFENIWSWLNKDDHVGDKVWIFKHDDIAAGGTINFSKRWKSEGDWEIFGHITTTPLCPADALDKVFGSIFGLRSMDESEQMSKMMVLDPQKVEKMKEDKGGKGRKSDARDGNVFDLKKLRAFRDGPFQEYPGVKKWWRLAEQNSPSLVHAVLTNPDLRGPLKDLMEYLPEALSNKKNVLSENHLALAERAITSLRSKTNNRRLAIDCSRALAVLPMLRGKSVGEALSVLNAVEPARHPRAANALSLRIAKPPARLAKKIVN